MPQNPDKIVDHVDLFKQSEYTELFKRKHEQFEGAHSDAEVERVSEWTKSWDYREKNFAREALTVNPAKGCQPVGAMFAALGFEGTLLLSKVLKVVLHTSVLISAVTTKNLALLFLLL